MTQRTTQSETMTAQVVKLRQLRDEAVSNCCAYTLQSNFREADRMKAITRECDELIVKLEAALTQGHPAELVRS